MSRKNLTLYLKKIDCKIRWNVRIKNYITNNKKSLEFLKDKKDYWCNIKTALYFIKTLKIDEVLKLKIENGLLRVQSEDLNNQTQVIPTQNIKKSLDATHFFIYNVKNIEELAKNILIELEEKEIKFFISIFTDYVYCFTYQYKYHSSKSNLITIRTLIKNSSLNEEKKTAALEIFRFSKRIHDFLDTGAKEKRDNNMNTKLKAIEVPNLFEFMEKYKNIDEKITKKNKKKIFTVLAAGFTLATGRRLSEAIEKIKSIEKIDIYKIKITGLAKKRDDEDKTIIIPTLYYTADEVIDRYYKILGILPKGGLLRNNRARGEYAHSLADFRNYVPVELWEKGALFDSLRSIYAIVSEVIYNQNNINEENKKPQATFIQQLLGHNSNDFVTYQHYYKRQVLLKNLDLNFYLSETKTAMM